MFEPDAAAPVVETRQPSIFSLGHSNHSLEGFLDLLAAYRIEVIADVRSAPWSKYVAWSNQPVLRKELSQRDIGYVFMGHQLGGKPAGAEYKGVEDRHELYRRIAESAGFREGIERLIRGAATRRVAMLCSEENPSVCHRHLLITPTLNERGLTVNHIRGNGALEAAAPGSQGVALAQASAAPQQLALL